MSSSLSQKTRDDIVVIIDRDDDFVRLTIQYDIIERQTRRMKRNLHIHDFVVASSMKRDRSLSIDQDMQIRLLEYIDLRFTTYLDEMIYFIYDTYDIVVNVFTIVKFLKRVS